MKYKIIGIVVVTLFLLGSCYDYYNTKVELTETKAQVEQLEVNVKDINTQVIEQQDLERKFDKVVEVNREVIRDTVKFIDETEKKNKDIDLVVEEPIKKEETIQRNVEEIEVSLNENFNSMFDDVNSIGMQ